MVSLHIAPVQRSFLTLPATPAPAPQADSLDGVQAALQSRGIPFVRQVRARGGCLVRPAAQHPVHDWPRRCTCAALSVTRLDAAWGLAHALWLCAHFGEQHALPVAPPLRQEVMEGGMLVEQLFFHDPDNNMIEASWEAGVCGSCLQSKSTSCGMRCAKPPWCDAGERAGSSY